MDVVFNTIPPVVLTREILEKMAKEALIIDIASSPGGVDFQAAADLNIRSHPGAWFAGESSTQNSRERS